MLKTGTRIAFLERTDLSSRKQRVHLLILCSLGVLAILLAMLLVLSSLTPAVPRWYRAHYFAGRVRAKVGFLKKQGLHSIHTVMGNMRDDVLVLKVGTNAWFLEALSPLD
ncbi:MAG: hypothetical protein WCT12_30350 [Verrucomicrobiota bacterium]